MKPLWRTYLWGPQFSVFHAGSFNWRKGDRRFGEVNCTLAQMITALVRPDSLQKLGYIVEFRGDIKANLCHGQDDDGVHLESYPHLCHWKAWKFQVFGIADLE